MHTKFWSENLKERDNSEDSVKREDSIKMWWEGVVWIQLAQDRDQWRAVCEHGNETSGSIKDGCFE